VIVIGSTTVLWVFSVSLHYLPPFPLENPLGKASLPGGFSALGCCRIPCSTHRPFRAWRICISSAAGRWDGGFFWMFVGDTWEIWCENGWEHLGDFHWDILGELEGIFMANLHEHVFVWPNSWGYTGEMMGNWWWCDVDYGYLINVRTWPIPYFIFIPLSVVSRGINNGSWTSWCF
jgi:hypothetical protein